MECICNQSQRRSLVSNNDLGKEHDDIESKEQDNASRSRKSRHCLWSCLFGVFMCGVVFVFVRWKSPRVCLTSQLPKKKWIIYDGYGYGGLGGVTEETKKKRMNTEGWKDKKGMQRRNGGREWRKWGMECECPSTIADGAKRLSECARANCIKGNGGGRGISPGKETEKGGKREERMER